MVFILAAIVIFVVIWIITAKSCNGLDEISARITDPYTPTDHEKLKREITALCDEYKLALSFETIGFSEEGRGLYLIKLGSGDKKVLFTGAIHGTEYISCAYLMRMTEIYAKAYENDISYGGYDVKKLLDETSIYIVPMLNPDGVERVQHEGLLWRANANGVNLNQNFPTDKWSQIDTGVYEPHRANFKGFSAASESETQAVIELCNQNDFEFVLSFHTKGEVLYWMDDNTGVIDGASRLTGKISNYTGYIAMQSTSEVNSYGGGLENWFRFAYNKPAICVELTPSNGSKQPHNDRDFDKLVWNKAKFLGLVVIE